MRNVIKLLILSFNLILISCKPDELSPSSSKLTASINEETENYFSNFIFEPIDLLGDTLSNTALIGCYLADCSISTSNQANFDNIRSIEITFPTLSEGSFSLENGMIVKVWLTDNIGYNSFSNDEKNSFTLTINNLGNQQGMVEGNFSGILFSDSDSILIDSEFSIQRLIDNSSVLEILNQTCL